MALSSQIDSAARSSNSKPVGAGIEQDGVHLLYMPAEEREYLLKQRARARHAVQRIAGPDAAELLAILGLDVEAS
jgi:hypothetical protein